MEDALVQRRHNTSLILGGVLILVLMEDALVPTSLLAKTSQSPVLILVLMEDALVLKNEDTATLELLS